MDDVVIAMTAWRRPGYLRRALESWSQTRGIEETGGIVISADPSDKTADIIAVADAARARGLQVTVRVNEEHLGPQANPVSAASHALEVTGAGFLILAEEDDIASTDTLEYMSWAREEFGGDSQVLGVCGHDASGLAYDAEDAGRNSAGADEEAVRLRSYYNPWIWGTWRDRWLDVLEPTWDRTCTSGGPGDSGFDWNIQLRVMPSGGYVFAVPDASRSQNIGRFEGVYAHPSNYPKTQTASFRQERGAVKYRVVTE
jgi:hypothetical protein